MRRLPAERERTASGSVLIAGSIVNLSQVGLGFSHQKRCAGIQGCRDSQDDRKRWHVRAPFDFPQVRPVNTCKVS